MRTQAAVPQTLDAPPLFLIFAADTAGVCCFFFILGLVFEMLFTFTLVGVVVAWFYARLRGSLGGMGLLVQLAYWSLPLKSDPPLYVKEWCG